MITINRTIAAVLIMLSILSCENKQTDTAAPIMVEVPSALQDERMEIKSYKRAGDLTENIYQELVDQSSGLTLLEKELEAYRSKPQEINNTFSNYDTKSEHYYTSANNKAQTITDSLLRNKIQDIITKSSKQYIKQTAAYTELLTQISSKVASLKDHHTVLKIVLTLPVIEKYQEDNSPNKNAFKDVIREQDRLIFTTDSLTPKY